MYRPDDCACSAREPGKMDRFADTDYLFWVKYKTASEFSNSVWTQMPALLAAKHERRMQLLIFKSHNFKNSKVLQ